MAFFIFGLLAGGVSGWLIFKSGDFQITDHDSLILCIKCHEPIDPRDMHVCPECSECGRPIA